MIASLRGWLYAASSLVAFALGCCLARHAAQPRRACRSTDDRAYWQQAGRSAVSRAADVRDDKGNLGLPPLDQVEAQAIYLGKTCAAQHAALGAKNAETEERGRRHVQLGRRRRQHDK